MVIKLQRKVPIFLFISFYQKTFRTQKFLAPKIFWPQNFFGPKLYWTQILCNLIFFGKLIFFEPTLFWTFNLFGLKTHLRMEFDPQGGKKVCSFDDLKLPLIKSLSWRWRADFYNACRKDMANIQRTLNQQDEPLLFKIVWVNLRWKLYYSSF